MSPSHKIKKIINAADLPKDLAEDLKKELESHFYEKERDLRLSGVSEEEVEQKVEEDFGDEEIVGSYFNFVHKKSFYSLIKTLMQNKNKPSIFYTVVLFIFLILFFQITIFDFGTAAQMSAEGQFDEFVASTLNNYRIVALGFILVTSFVLIGRLYRGGALSQKVVSGLLFIVFLGEMGITYSFLNALPEVPISDHELIQNPQAYYDQNDGEWINFYNEADGYQLNLPQSYLAYRKDGSSDLIKYFFPNSRTGFKPEAGEIVAFGPAYADDQEMIEVQVFDADNSPDKKEDETWLDYYSRTKLQNNFTQKEPVAVEGFFDDGTLITVPGVNRMYLSNPLKKRHTIFTKEYNDRFYVFLYDEQNKTHREILGVNIGAFTPEKKVKWVTFNESFCPFVIQIPDNWYATEDKSAGFDECLPLDFSYGEGRFDMHVKIAETPNLSTRDFNGSKIISMGETEWQGMPAYRFLLDRNAQGEAGFAVELKTNQWLIFQYQPQDKQVEKILNTLVIKD